MSAQPARQSLRKVVRAIQLFQHLVREQDRIYAIVRGPAPYATDARCAKWWRNAHAEAARELVAYARDFAELESLAPEVRLIAARDEAGSQTLPQFKQGVDELRGFTASYQPNRMFERAALAELELPRLKLQGWVERTTAAYVQQTLMARAPDHTKPGAWLEATLLLTDIGELIRQLEIPVMEEPPADGLRDWFDAWWAVAGALVSAANLRVPALFTDPFSLNRRDLNCLANQIQMILGRPLTIRDRATRDGFFDRDYTIECISGLVELWRGLNQLLNSLDATDDPAEMLRVKDVVERFEVDSGTVTRWCLRLGASFGCRKDKAGWQIPETALANAGWKARSQPRKSAAVLSHPVEWKCYNCGETKVGKSRPSRCRCSRPSYTRT